MNAGRLEQDAFPGSSHNLSTQFEARASGLKRWQTLLCDFTNDRCVRGWRSVKDRNLDDGVLVAELKTKANEANVQEFLETISDDQRRKDCLELMKLLAKITKAEAKIWGSNIIGFGTFRLRYPNGREIDWMQVGLSPRKQNLTL
jgi:hypothetical protein